jgi:hypothetical protein
VSLMCLSYEYFPRNFVTFSVAPPLTKDNSNNVLFHLFKPVLGSLPLTLGLSGLKNSSFDSFNLLLFCHISRSNVKKTFLVRHLNFSAQDRL